jgi:hypothetical protein
VIKTAAYFPLQSALNANPVLSAVCTSMVWHGITMQKDSLDSDCAVIWSVLWNGRMKQNRHVYEHYRSLGRPVIVIDVGYLQRGVTWRIGVNHINRKANFGTHQPLDPDRPAKLGVALKQADKHPEILIALQHSRSLQTESIKDSAAWALEKVSEIRQHSDRPIVIRPHPRDRVVIGNVSSGVRVEHPRRLVGTYDSYDWNDRYHAVVNHNSGPGVLAAIAGVRPVVDESSLAWPVSVSMDSIEKPYCQDRQQWLIELSHCEYTVPEIESGVWLKKLECSLS